MTCYASSPKATTLLMSMSVFLVISGLTNVVLNAVFICTSLASYFLCGLFDLGLNRHSQGDEQHRHNDD